MSCEEVGAKLSLYVAGDIERQGAGEAIAAHLRSCESCRALADEWQASRRMLLLHEPPEFDAAFFDGVRRDVMRQISEPPPPPLFARLLGQPFGPRTLAYATAFSVLACAVILSSHFLKRSETPGVNRSETPSVAVVREGHDTSGDARPNGTRPPDAATHGGKTNQDALTVPEPRPAPAQRRRTPRVHAGAPGAAPGERLPRAPEVRSGGPGRIQAFAEPRPEPEASATIAGSRRLVETAAADRKMLRIEFQTSDPNVRIIWLSPQADGHASSNKVNDRR